MASGPEHFHEAQRLLSEAAGIASNHDETNPAAGLLIAEAQVHATLALAAATALGGFLADPQFRKPLYPYEEDAWLAVAGTSARGGGAATRGASFSNGPSPDGNWLQRQLPRPLATRFTLMEGDPFE